MINTYQIQQNAIISRSCIRRLMILAALVISFHTLYAGRLKNVFSLFPGTDGVYEFGYYDDFDIFRYSNYYIGVKKLEQGSDIYIKYLSIEEKAPGPDEMLEQCDYLIKNERAEYFKGIYKNYLFIESGIKTFPRGLQIYDIMKKERLMITEYSPPLSINEKGTVVFWRTIRERSDNDAGKKWRAAAISMEIQEKIRINLKSLEVIETGETRITPGQ